MFGVQVQFLVRLALLIRIAQLLGHGAWRIVCLVLRGLIQEVKMHKPRLIRAFVRKLSTYRGHCVHCVPWELAVTLVDPVLSTRTLTSRVLNRVRCRM